MKKLVLHVEREYFDQIESGEKVEEYRERKTYWNQRLIDVHYDVIEVIAGYPKRGEGRRLLFEWDGCRKMDIRHRIFGGGVTPVFAISLRKPIEPSGSKE